MKSDYLDTITEINVKYHYYWTVSSTQSISKPKDKKIMKTVENIKMKTGFGDLVVNGGTLTEDGKYVVSAVARFTGASDEDLKVSRKNANVRTKMDNRLDVAIYEYDQETGEQGDAIVDYLSMGVMTTVSTARGRSQLLVGLDNESTRQYKTVVMGNKFWDAVQVEAKRAIDDATNELINGTSKTRISNVDLVENAENYSKAAQIAQAQAAKRKLAAAAGAATAAPASNSAAGAKLASLLDGDSKDTAESSEGESTEE